MKKTQYLLAIIISLIILTFFGSTAQSEVCMGDYTIEGIDANDDIAVLSGCTEITGNLTITNTTLTSLSGLENLISVGENFAIYDNNFLTSLNGLENLTTVGGILDISENYFLTSLNGLEGLTNVDNSLGIGFNNSLTSLSGLENLTSVGGGLYIFENYSLTSLSGLENLTEIYDLRIRDNYSLANLCALYNAYLDGTLLEIYDNNVLSMDTAYALETQLRNNGFTGTATIERNFGTEQVFCNNVCVGNYTIDGIDTSGDIAILSGCTEITGELTIGDFHNPTTLENLNGLESLTSVGGGLLIYYNNALTSLNGLENLTTVGEFLEIGYNAALTNLCALYNVNLGANTLVIGDNNALSMATTNALKDQLTSNGFTGNFYIEDNNGAGIVCCGLETDNDNDLICSDTDNCPDIANPNQENADEDVFGDACDEDTIYGTISGAVQEGVTVNIYHLTCGVSQPYDAVTTDVKGYYAIGNVEDGRYLLSAEETGYSFSSGFWVNIPQAEIQSYDFSATAD